MARMICPEYEFLVADVFKSEILSSRVYDCVLMIEFLEHVKGDKDAIRRINAGTIVYGAVPNFSNPAHVRYFRDVDEVQERYSDVFARLRVDVHLANGDGKEFFILEGWR